MSLLKSLQVARKFLSRDEVRGKSIGYRPELDGIRGIAIIIIVFHHFDYVGLQYFGGRGFLAVDIFFVLSGFLITQILLTYREKSIKLRSFYRRRIARLYPILLVSVVGISYYFRNNYQFLDRTPAEHSILYIKNFWPWGGVFGPMWSLSAEEQFYIIFPIILFIGLRIWKKNIFTLFLVFWLAGIWYIGYKSSGVDHNFNKDGIFNLVVFRPSIILVGCLIAIHFQKLKELVSKMTSLWALVLVGLFYAAYKTQYPPVVGIATGLLILILSEEIAVNNVFAKVLRQVLALKPLAWIGLLSYSIYIWHLPMIFISTQHFQIHAIFPMWEFFVKLLAVAVISFYFFEKPVVKLLTFKIKNQ